MGENSTETTFKCGDLVFAKLADYPPWPAKIIEIDDGQKFKVVFFATCNEAIVDLDHIYAYVDNKEHFKADQEMLRIQYDEAVEQVERELSGKQKEDSSSKSSSDDDDEPMPIKRRVPNEGIAAQPDNNTTSVVGGPWINEIPSVDDDDDDDDDGDGDGDGDDDDDKEDIINPIFGENEDRSHIIENNFLLVYMASAKCYGIDLTFGKPNSFPSSAAEDDWMRNSNEQAIVLKIKMLSGVIDVDAMPGRIVCNPKRDQITEYESLQFLDELVMQKYSLRGESCFVRLSEKVRNSLGLSRAHVDGCLEVLKELESIELNKLLLLRNPGCVDIVRRLRAYIGNYRSWNLSAADEKAFKTKTRFIRHVAQFIYLDMVHVFFPKWQSDSGFWIKYCERVLVYEDYIAKHRVRAGLQGLLGHNQSN